MDVLQQSHGSAAERRLQETVGSSSRADLFYRTQVLDRLNDEMRAFVGQQEMALLATADGQGACDCSFRAGPPRFVHVLDASTLAFPEYRGNGVMASAANIGDNGHAALLILDFRRRIGLHVNGPAELVAPEQMRSQAPEVCDDEHPGRRPVLWVVVRVEEAYVHCSKHIPLLVPLPEQQHWGTDDHKRKGGDFFQVAASRSGDG